MAKITNKIIRKHNKATEIYIDVTFHFDDGNVLSTSVPIFNRRTGTDIHEDKIDDYLQKVLEEIKPSERKKWIEEQVEFWKTMPKAEITKKFFDPLISSFEWCCRNCNFPSNPNSARRIQALKQLGYSLATQPKRKCPKCNKKTTHDILVPIKRGGITGYESWSAKIRDKITNLLNDYDAFEGNRVNNKGFLLPDHKFPEIRWDKNTKRLSLDTLSDEEIKQDFQLLSNQRNLQKREVCRECFQTNKRGVIYGIPFFYEGNESWDGSIPTSGKLAEKGCIGCGWYDIEKWRLELAKKIKE